jgi:hypothetical protein
VNTSFKEHPTNQSKIDIEYNGSKVLTLTCEFLLIPSVHVPLEVTNRLRQTRSIDQGTMDQNIVTSKTKWKFWSFYCYNRLLKFEAL